MPRPSPGWITTGARSRYENINVLGSTAAGWFTLPQPRSYYVPGGSLNFGLIADDCTALADLLIYYPGFIGINLMFNDIFDWRTTMPGAGVGTSTAMAWVSPIA